MKFTDGYWVKRPGYVVEHPRQLQEVLATETGLIAFAPTHVVRRHGDELDTPMVTTTIDALAPDVVRVRIEHFQGARDNPPHFELSHPEVKPEVSVDGFTAQMRTGDLEVHVAGEDKYELSFRAKGKQLTSSIYRSTGLVTKPDGEEFVHEQLTIDVGEAVYGLGERFGPVVRNGQVVDIWNADGGTASEQAYKNVPFYMTNGGYGVLVNHAEKVSFEVGSESNSRVQFSVPGQKLEYILIYGPSPKEILRKYTALTGRAPQVPAWSYGLWLSTSFTTDYSEETVNGFVDKMEELDLPLSVIHFDCYWMRPSHWSDFTWDPAKFPDPEGMLKRYHDRDLKVCVWINPYIGQRSHLFAEGMRHGYLLKREDGSVRQWDHWQSGMGWVDFTNPDAVDWWKGELKKLLAQGVDSFKTDFGERVPTDVVWHDGSDPFKMHNYYSYLYNKAAFEAIAEVKGEDEAIVFARSATTGGQSLPVHWGGDSEPTFVSMAETLRGGLSIGLSGFGYWSHDMGGFEGTPNDDVFIRWFPFGMLSSHSRLHGSHSYRVPWNYGETAVEVARVFIALKNRLMPYLLSHAEEITTAGTPLLRHMMMEYPEDRGSVFVDTQYLLGPDLLVAPVFTESGDVDVYLPTAGWTDILSGERIEQHGWVRQNHDLETLPLLVPDGTVLPLGANAKKPDYDWSDGVLLYLFAPQEGTKTVRVPKPDKSSAEFTVTRSGADVTVSAVNAKDNWKVVVVGGSVESDTAQQIEDAPVPEIVGGTVLETSGDSLSFRLV